MDGGPDLADFGPIAFQVAEPEEDRADALVRFRFTETFPDVTDGNGSSEEKAGHEIRGGELRKGAGQVDVEVGAGLDGGRPADLAVEESQDGGRHQDRKKQEYQEDVSALLHLVSSSQLRIFGQQVFAPGRLQYIRKEEPRIGLDF